MKNRLLVLPLSLSFSWLVVVVNVKVDGFSLQKDGKCINKGWARSSPLYSMVMTIEGDDDDASQQHQQAPTTSSISATATEQQQPMVEYNDFLPQPGPDLDALDVVHACMRTFLARDKDNNNHVTAGLEVCFAFSSDRLRAVLGGSLEQFHHYYASHPVFGYLVHCDEYVIQTIGPVIAGTATRGAMQTVLMDVIQYDNDNDNERGDNNNKTPRTETSRRRFLWTLQQERRPPRQGFWVVHECIDTKYAGSLTT